MTTPTSTSKINQQDYDEAVLENEECFDLAPEEAVQETNDQFLKLDKNFLRSDVISRTHPHSDNGKVEREDIRKFVLLLNELSELVSEEITDKISQLSDLLDKIEEVLMPGDVEPFQSNINDFDALRNHRLSQRCYTCLTFEYNGFYFLSKVMIYSPSSDDCCSALKCLNSLLKGPRSVDFQGQFVAFEDTAKCLQKFIKMDHDPQAKICLKFILILVHLSCKGNERAKVTFMRCKGFADSILTVLRNCLQRLSLPENNEENFLQHQSLCQAAAQCIVTLCKYEDSGNKGEGGITVSSAHDHAQTFFRYGAVPILSKINKFVQEEKISGNKNDATSLAVASMQATRVLAINDEIVQVFVAAGTLVNIQNTLRIYRYSPNLVAAAMGVIRNMCGNDEIKSTLTCNGTLQEMLENMRQYKTVAIIQEHGCGALAAMALRKPENAQAIASLGGVNDIVSAMKTHENNVLVQRQGALACRNIISRSNHLRELFLEHDAESALRKAGERQGSVDEAYAALRDIGCKVEIIKFDGSGKQVKLAMFGDAKPSFNPSFEASTDLNGRVESRAKYAPKLVKS